MKWAWAAWLLIGIPLFVDVARAQVVEIERIAVTVSDLDQTEAFYRDGLGFETLARRFVDLPDDAQPSGPPARAEILTMGLGAEQVEFIHFAKAGRSYPSSSRASDLWFQHFAVVVSDMDAAYARLQNVRFRPISLRGPQTFAEKRRTRAGVQIPRSRWSSPRIDILSCLVRAERFGETSARVIDLGIDHTAISVSQTPASLAFYVNLLGMKVAYQTVNHGLAQDRLDDVRGSESAHHRFASGITRRPWPRVARLPERSPRKTGAERIPAITDLWHAHIVLRVAGLDTLIARLHRQGVRFVSSGAIPRSKDVALLK